MRHMKKALALVLMICMLLTLMPMGQVCAAPVVSAGTEWECLMFERDAHSETVTTGPALSEGNHEKWIDRIGNLPDFARDFYSWLEDNATSKGALADTSLGQDYGGREVYLVETVTGSVPFSYAQGDDLSDLAYDAAVADLGTVPSSIVNYVFAVYGAFDRDHPEVFWLTGNSRCGSSIDYSYQNASGGMATATYTLRIYFYLTTDSFDIRAEDYRTVEAIAAGEIQREADVARILADYPADGSIYEQIVYFNNSLTLTNAFNTAVWNDVADLANPIAWECVSALKGSTGAKGPVCEGYSRAFKLLCDRVGIPCVLTEGYSEGGSHMWNNVWMGDGWYGVDVTWNDPVNTGNLQAKVSGKETDYWIGLGSNTLTTSGETFSQTHVVENVTVQGGQDYCNGPVLEENTYEAPSNYLDITAYRSGEDYTAPEKSGFVFGGWFADAALTKPIPVTQTTGWAYAKFVDAATLTVKIQTTYGTTAQSAETDLRLLTSVAGLDLSKVCFDVTIGTTTQTITSNTVYVQVKAGDKLISDPASVFGPDSAYFVTYTLLGVPQSGFELDITAVPSWQTLDGTMVYGTARTFRISETY